MDAASVGVLRDVAILVWVALLIGSIAYAGLRRYRPALAWNWRGRVDARPFMTADALVVAAISALLLGGMQAGAEPAAPVSAEAPTLTVEGLLGNIALLLMFCAGLLFYLRSVRGLDPASLFGLRQGNPFKAIGLALVFIIPSLLVVNSYAYAITEWMRSFWPNLSAQDTVQAFRSSEDHAARALMIFTAVIIAPLVEETIFRGFIYGVIKRYTDAYFAALCSALLFAIVHFHVGSMFPLAVLALCFCLAYELTGNLLVPMAMHAFFNGASLLALSFLQAPPPP